jgi:putative transposase
MRRPERPHPARSGDHWRLGFAAFGPEVPTRERRHPAGIPRQWGLAHHALAKNHSPVPTGWYSRGYLPHFDNGPVPQAVSFRLAGALPAELIANWRKQAAIAHPANQAIWLHRLAEAELDRCRHAALSDPAFAAAVRGALLYFHPRRYTLHSWVVMPNHVHVLLTPAPGHSLAAIVHSWKSFTAKHPAAPLPCWQREYFDRFMRDARHVAAQARYIERNPVEAGLCARPEDWPWSSVSARAPGACRQDAGARSGNQIWRQPMQPA